MTREWKRAEEECTCAKPRSWFIAATATATFSIATLKPPALSPVICPHPYALLSFVASLTCQDDNVCPCYLFKTSDGALTDSRWDTLTGRKSSSATTSSTLPSSSDSMEPAGISSFQIQTPSAPSTDSFVFDSTQLHPLAGLNQDALDYLTLEDSVLSELPGGRSALPSRGWSDDLCYGTGVTYLSALALGGAWGMAEGLNRSSHVTSPKLRLNAVLNAVTRRGPFLGNNAGVIAMVYNGELV